MAMMRMMTWGRFGSAVHSRNLYRTRKYYNFLSLDDSMSCHVRSTYRTENQTGRQTGFIEGRQTERLAAPRYIAAAVTSNGTAQIRYALRTLSTVNVVG